MNDPPKTIPIRAAFHFHAKSTIFFFSQFCLANLSMNYSERCHTKKNVWKRRSERVFARLNHPSITRHRRLKIISFHSRCANECTVHLMPNAISLITIFFLSFSSFNPIDKLLTEVNAKRYSVIIMLGRMESGWHSVPACLTQPSVPSFHLSHRQLFLKSH